jgi:hypothetical protein
MNKFRRLFANDMDAQQSHVVLPKEQLQPTAFIADNLATRIIGATRPTDDVADALPLQRLFGFTNHARLRNRVNASRQNRCDPVSVVAYREARLFRARCSERRCTNNITRRENMGNRRATMRIHFTKPRLAAVRPAAVRFRSAVLLWRPPATSTSSTAMVAPKVSVSVIFPFAGASHRITFSSRLLKDIEGTRLLD